MTDEELWQYISKKEKPAPKKEIEIEQEEYNKEFFNWINENTPSTSTILQGETKI